MDASFQRFLVDCRNLADEALSLAMDDAVTRSQPNCCPSSASMQSALDYVAQMRGKRLRPSLLCATVQISDNVLSRQALLAATGSVELIHTYSLIHDDLPAMDDDDLRRGIPTLHKRFDEATAILVGDGLQARALGLIANAESISDGQRVRMIATLADAAGFDGMVGGQFLDIQATGQELTLEELQTLHALKTGALIRASVALGGIAANATEEQLSALDEYASHIGLAFQVVDDIIDVEGTTESLGKTQGKDEANDKATYVKLLGLEGAKLEANRLLEAALSSLNGFDDRADHLRSLARYIVERDF